MQGKRAGCRSLYVFLVGEGNDDLTRVFYIDENDYSDVETARADLREAGDTLAGLRIISEVHVANGEAPLVGLDLPSWRQFRQRHFVERVPLPVRSVPLDRRIPPGWDQMWSEMHGAVGRLRDELTRTLERGLAVDVRVNAIQEPTRQGPASADFTEERYGFFVALEAVTGGDQQEQVLARLARSFGDLGWVFGPPEWHGSDLECTATRDAFSLWISVEPRTVALQADSPLYRVLPAPETGWAVEARHM